VNKETLEQASFSLDLVQLAGALRPEPTGEGIAAADREEKARITTILYTAES
jgi:hypothetical protein